MDTKYDIYLDSMAFGRKNGHVYCALQKSDMSVFGAHLISAKEAVRMLEGKDNYRVFQERAGIVCIDPVPADPEMPNRPLGLTIVLAFSILETGEGGRAYPDLDTDENA